MPPVARRSLLQSALVGVTLFLPRATFAGQDILQVSGPGELAAALSGAEGGETIRLAPGPYGHLVLDTRRSPNADFPRPVTLVSADPADPAVFAEASLRGVGNLVLDGLRFDYRFTPGHPVHVRPFVFESCRSLTIRHSVFDGDLARAVSPEQDGLGFGIGLTVRRSRDVRIANNRITRFFRGLVISGSRDVAVTGNELSGLRMDGMNFSQMQDVRIEGNFIHGFLRSTLKSDHADMIQFWTNNTKTPSTGITIRGNLLSAGDGDHTQSIFMRNDLVDRGRAGPEMFYRDVLIEENVILNGHLHGITLGESAGAVIRRNTVLRDPAFATGPDREKSVRIPRISVRADSVRVVVTDNIVSAVPKAQPGWKVTGNLPAQDLGRMKPGFYGLLFEKRPPSAGAGRPPGADLASRIALRYLPGGPADRPGLGAALMR